MKKYRYLIMLAMLAIVLAACTEQEKSKQEFLQANENKETLSIEEIDDKALYRWTLTEEVEAIAIEESGELIEHDQPTLFGEPGEESFRGNVSLYLIHEEVEEGYLQETIEGVQLNMAQSFKEVETFQERPVIAWTEIVSEDVYLRSMWQYTDGELQAIRYGDATQIAVTAEDVLWIDEQFMQVHVVEPYGVGPYEKQWKFQTWEWADDHFTLKDERFFKDTALNRLGEQVAKLSVEEHKPLPFERLEPETYTITKTALPEFKEGQFLNGAPKVGDSLLEAIFKMPTHTDQKVLKSDLSITFSDGFTYMYEADTFQITGISLNGQQLTSSLTSLRNVLGKASANSYDVEEAVYTEKYAVGDYRIIVTYRKDEQRYTIQFTKK